MVLTSEQTAFESVQNSTTYKGWIFKLETATYQSKTLHCTLKHTNMDSTASGTVTLNAYPIGSSPWTPGTLIGSFGTLPVPTGDNVTEDAEFPDAVAIPPAGAWLLLDLSGVTNQDKYAVRATESPVPPAYDPWLICFKYKDDDTVVSSGTQWFYSIFTGATPSPGSNGSKLPPPPITVRF